MIVARALVPRPVEGEDLARLSPPSGATCARPRQRASTIWLAAQISTSASQIVAMPCSGTASTRMAISFIRKSIGVVRWVLARLKNGISHEILRVSGGQIAGESSEEFELLAFVSGAMARHGSAARLTGLGRDQGAVTLRREHGADTRVGG